jgi:hypothetical protein
VHIASWFADAVGTSDRSIRQALGDGVEILFRYQFPFVDTGIRDVELQRLDDLVGHEYNEKGVVVLD